MYRKMIFIFFTIISSLSNQQKALILLAISIFSANITLKKQPFILASLNNIEVESNVSALVTIFAGAFYVLNINETVKIMIFIIIILINTQFAYKWIVSVCEVLVYTHEKEINRFCPCLLSLYAVYKKTKNETPITYNLPKYVWIFFRNLLTNKNNFVLIKE